LKPTVVILTYCADPALAYGSLLVFDSLRIGYPTNDIVVIDNGSHVDIRAKIKDAAISTSCAFVQKERFNFVDHFQWLLFDQMNWSSVVLVDPDVVFWEKMQLSKTNALMTGRLIPQFKRSNVVSMSRLHPSHLYFSSLEKLRDNVATIPSWGFNPIGQTSAAIDGVLHSWDTCAPLYHAFKNDCLAFNEDQLNSYDHLFYGSHLPLLKSLKETDVPCIAHNLVKNNRVPELKHIWRAQEKYFAEMA